MPEEHSLGVEAALDAHIDPVAAANEYRETLLQLVGDRDPVQVVQKLPDEVEEVVRQAGDDLRTRPAPDEWSVIELLGHLVDAEIVLAGRYRWILAHDEPPLMAYDQDRWVERLHHQDDDPGELLALLRALIRSHVRLWERTSETDRARVGVHAERGPESFEVSFRMLAGHGLLGPDAEDARPGEEVRGLARNLKNRSLISGGRVKPPSLQSVEDQEAQRRDDKRAAHHPWPRKR